MEESCQVCNSTENLHYCGKCYDVVYCGKACQQKDYAEHLEHECKHPDQMTDAEIMDEIQIRMAIPDHDDEEHFIGVSIAGLSLIEARSRFAEWKRNRKVKRKSGTARKSTKSLNREKRRANREKRTARRAARRQAANKRALKRRDTAAARRDKAQDTVLSSN